MDKLSLNSKINWYRRSATDVVYQNVRLLRKKEVILLFFSVLVENLKLEETFLYNKVSRLKLHSLLNDALHWGFLFCSEELPSALMKSYNTLQGAEYSKYT